MADALMINSQIVFNVVCALIATATSIISWYQKRHYADIDKKIEDLQSSEKITTERMHQMALTQARSEALTTTINELKSEIRDLRSDVHEVKIQLTRQSVPDLRHIVHGK